MRFELTPTEVDCDLNAAPFYWLFLQSRYVWRKTQSKRFFNGLHLITRAESYLFTPDMKETQFNKIRDCYRWLPLMMVLRAIWTIGVSSTQCFSWLLLLRVDFLAASSDVFLLHKCSCVWLIDHSMPLFVPIVWQNSLTGLIDQFSC